METKTPQEILAHTVGGICNSKTILEYPSTNFGLTYAKALGAMETYAKQQTESKQAAMDKLAAALKKRLVEINEMPNHIAEFCNEEKDEITATLEECGYKTNN